MKKQFLTYSQQLDNLVREKGLEVPDRQEAIETLKHISYFALINGYKEPFRGKDGKYLDGVTFQDIRALYRFDVALSSTLLRYLLSCERHLKSLFGYHFIQLYGDSEQDYLNPNNYDRSTEQRAREVRELLDTMRDLAREESDQEYLGHYRTHYEEVPLWIIMHALTFGQLERLYWCAQPHLRDVICSEFPNLRSKNLTYVLLVLVHLRNTCAHNNPVYTFRLKNIFLPVMSVHHDLGLVNKEGKARAGQKDLFAGLLAMKLILSGREYCALCADIDREMQTLLKSSSWLTEDKLLPLMGFPADWRESCEAQS